MKLRNSLLLTLASSAVLFIPGDERRMGLGSTSPGSETRMSSSRADSERAIAEAETALARALSAGEFPAKNCALAPESSEDEAADRLVLEILEYLDAPSLEDMACDDIGSEASDEPAVCLCAQRRQENADPKIPATVMAGDLHPLQKSCSVLKTSASASFILPGSRRTPARKEF